jgi:hypothetical protein
MTTKMNLEWIFNDTALPDPHGYGERAAKFIRPFGIQSLASLRNSFSLIHGWNVSSDGCTRHSAEQATPHQKLFLC